MSQQRTFHIEIDEGMDYSTTFALTDPSTSLPISTAGYHALLEVRGEDFAAQSNLLIYMTYSDVLGTIVLGGANGIFTLNIPAAATVGLLWDKATYDLILTSPTGSRSKFVKGFFLIKPSTTKF